VAVKKRCLARLVVLVSAGCGTATSDCPPATTSGSNSADPAFGDGGGSACGRPDWGERPETGWVRGGGEQRRRPGRGAAVDERPAAGSDHASSLGGWDRPVGDREAAWASVAAPSIGRTCVAWSFN